MLLSILFSLALLDPHPQQLPVMYRRECLVRRAVLEIGPSLTKIGVADMDICKQRMLTHLYEEKDIDYAQANGVAASEVAQNKAIDKITEALDHLRLRMLSQFATQRKAVVCAFSRDQFSGLEVAKEAGIRLGFTINTLSKKEAHHLALKAMAMQIIPGDEYHKIIWDKDTANHNAFSTLNQNGTFDTEEFPIKAKILQGAAVVGIHPHHQQMIEYVRSVMVHPTAEVTMQEIQRTLEYAKLQLKRNFFWKDKRTSAMVAILMDMLETMQHYGITALFVVPYHSVDGMLAASCEAPVI